MITFYGRKTSDSVQKALWMLLETGQPFTHLEKGGRFGGLDDPAFLALNPHGRVPVLVDGDLVVWESNAIVRYLAARYGAGTWWLEDPVARAAGDQWMDWAQTQLYPVFNRLFWLTVRTPLAQQDAQQITDIRERLIGYYRTLDAHLAGRDFVAGERVTMADIPSGATLYRYFEMPIARPALPHIARWYDRLRERPAYQQAVMVSFEELRGRLAY